MNNNDKNSIEKLKMKIAIFNVEKDIRQKSTECLLKRKERLSKSFMKKKIIATACVSLILASGIVVATNIENIKTHFRGLGNGIDTAIENGYIANPSAEEIDTNTVAISNEIKVDNINAKINIENFLMDDVNLSTQILFEFDNKIKEIVDLNKVTAIELNDLIIRDEENKIIYGGNNEEKFKKYCEENNLNYTFCEFNDNYMNCGVNCFNVMKDTKNNKIKIMYNMYTFGTYPKSKKLYLSFGKIEMLKLNSEKATQDRVIINGDWKITVDVPKEMYTRTEEYYKVVNCDSKDFNVYTAKVTNTGFEIGIIISNIERPEKDIKKEEEFDIALDDYHEGKISEQEYNKKALWNKEYNDLLNPIQVANSNYVDGENGKASYVENEDGVKFKSTLSPTRRAKNYFMDGKKFDFYDTFSMTKYDSTDNIKIVLYYYGEPVNIELEKV